MQTNSSALVDFTKDANIAANTTVFSDPEQ